MCRDPTGREKFPHVQLSNLFTQELLPVGEMIKWFVHQWEKRSSGEFHLELLRHRYHAASKDFKII